MAIDSFSGHYWFLSNFAEEGAIKPTLEHQFQAHKASTVEDAIYVMSSDSPGLAKRRGREILLRPDWDEIKIDIMRDLVWKKFYYSPELTIKLLDTGEAELIEGNHWNDFFWGVCKGKGLNWLGKILMETRGKLETDRLRSGT